MIHLPRKFVAVLLAIWLPLFSGNALAASIAMQSMSGDCHVAMQTSAQNHDASMYQHMQHASQLQQSAQMHQSQQHFQQHSGHNDCGVCQIACCGFLATVAIEIAEAQPLAQMFAPYTTQFQSVFSAPLVPPPLALA